LPNDVNLRLPIACSAHKYARRQLNAVRKLGGSSSDGRHVLDQAHRRVYPAPRRTRRARSEAELDIIGEEAFADEDAFRRVAQSLAVDGAFAAP